MDYTKMSYNQLSSNFEKGLIDSDELMEQYKRMRDSALKQIRIIEKSDVPFISADRPEFAKPSEIKNSRDLLHAVSDINAFKTGGYYTLTERREHRDKDIETMHQHKMYFVDEGNYPKWAKFMEWFKANNVQKVVGSKDDVVEDFFMEYEDAIMEMDGDELTELFEEFTGEEVPGPSPIKNEDENG